MYFFISQLFKKKKDFTILFSGAFEIYWLKILKNYKFDVWFVISKFYFIKINLIYLLLIKYKIVKPGKGYILRSVKC